MRLVPSWAFRTLALPTAVLLGLGQGGCDPETSGTTDSSGGGGSGGSGGSVTSAGGFGGSPCTPETEICDTKDNDCDGVVDNVANLPNGCACYEGDEQACYMGPEGTENVGACVAGMQSCVGGLWGECNGVVVPTPEVCNLQDDNCDGDIDNMGVATCGIGSCQASIEKCINGVAQSCVPLQPALEVCDGIDNDCDTMVDESDPQENGDCLSGEPGICSLGIYACLANELVCVPNQMPQAEVCDGVDTDCDGNPDNGVPGTGGTCDTGAPGVCGEGAFSCGDDGSGFVIGCFSVIPPSNEVCDNLDNDCNGMVDDGNPGGGATCSTGLLGVCQAGTMTCGNGVLSCVQNTPSTPEACNGLDDDCNGMVDENNPQANEPCGCGGTGISSCVAGALQCTGEAPTFLSEDFSDNSAGWILGPEWQIGPAVQGPAGDCSDPGMDTSPSSDNGVAGVVIGGCSTSSASKTLHPYYYLTSPVVNTSAAPTVFLSFKRWLLSDYTTFMNNSIEVFDGTGWVQIWASGGSPGIYDSSWKTIGHDLTAYKNATMQVRFGFNIGSTGVYTVGSWSIDDVVLAEGPCP